MTDDGREPIPRPALLRIDDYIPIDRPEGVAIQPGKVWLKYCDEDGDEMNDTDHASVEEAMEVARVKYNVSVDEWSI